MRFELNQIKVRERVGWLCRKPCSSLAMSRTNSIAADKEQFYLQRFAKAPVKNRSEISVRRCSISLIW